MQAAFEPQNYQSNASFVPLFYERIDFHQEFDLTMIEWDQETLDRWKTFARSGKVIPAEATAYPVASHPLVVSPSRNRPAFRGARARVVAQGSNH